MDGKNWSLTRPANQETRPAGTGFRTNTREKVALHLTSLVYSFSNPWAVNFSVRAFSVTMRTTFSGAPSGIWA